MRTDEAKSAGLGVDAEPPGAVAIWHDIVPEGLDEFYAWHGEEHMPERVGIPGFRRGRRFIAIEADLGYFNIYETRSFAAISGPDYKARLDSPTPRTLSAVRHFRNVARSLCRVAAETSPAQGGIIATLRYDVEPERAVAHLRAVTDRVLPALAQAPGIASARLLVADKASSGYVNAEQRARGAPNRVPAYVLVVEGWAEPEPFMAQLRSSLGPDACRGLGIADAAALGFYRHQVTIPAATA
jgi:hypothetical protein